MLKDGDTIIVGVSGGPDSMALLNILWNICKEGKINFTIVVAHFNHALRKEADEETSGCYRRRRGRSDRRHMGGQIRRLSDRSGTYGPCGQEDFVHRKRKMQFN